MGRFNASLRINGTLCVAEPGPVAPSFNGDLDAIHFSKLVKPLALVMTHTDLSLTGTPMYSYLRASNSIPGQPRNCCMKIPPLIFPIVRPSGLATLKT